MPQPGGIVACGGLSEPHDIPDATAFSIPIAVAGSQDSTATATAPITAAEEAAVRFDHSSFLIDQACVLNQPTIQKCGESSYSLGPAS